MPASRGPCDPAARRASADTAGDRATGLERPMLDPDAPSTSAQQRVVPKPDSAAEPSACCTLPRDSEKWLSGCESRRSPSAVRRARRGTTRTPGRRARAGPVRGVRSNADGGLRSARASCDSAITSGMIEVVVDRLGKRRMIQVERQAFRKCETKSTSGSARADGLSPDRRRRRPPRQQAEQRPRQPAAAVRARDVLPGPRRRRSDARRFAERGELLVGRCRARRDHAGGRRAAWRRGSAPSWGPGP